MRLLAVARHLAAQGEPLGHAEAVLLVDDGQRQVLEFHLVLNHGVRANHQPGFAAFNQRQHFAPHLGFLAAGQPGRLDAQRFQPAQQLAKMLIGQDFGRRHQRALPARVDAAGRRQRRHHGFASADIALQQAVHGHIFDQVGVNFRADALLGSRQPERQAFQQLRMQRWLLRTPQHRPLQRRRAHRSPHAPSLQLRDLLRQQFLGLQALPGRMAAVFKRLQRHIGRRMVQKL